MWLTKNEKGVLKLLVANAKLSDTSIAKELNISSQAVGRIRERLEEDIIQKYTVDLDSKRLGINIIAIIKITFKSLENKNIEKIEKEIVTDWPEIVFCFKIMSGRNDYLILAGFQGMEELEKLMRENGKKGDYIINEIIPLPLNCILKKSFIGLYNKMIDLCGTKHAEVDIN